MVSPAGSCRTASVGSMVPPIPHRCVRGALSRRFAARGLTNAEIAEMLQLSPYTAKTHVSRIVNKLAARDRVQLVVLAYQAGIARA
jgi:Bacterial regulatory proteins, luxR family